MSYPPYHNGPRSNPPQPNNPYQNGPFPQQPQQPGPYGGGQTAPRPPYGGQPPYGGGQPPYGAGRPPYGAQPPQGGGMPPYGGGRPPFGGGPGGPGGPGLPGGPGGPRGSKKGLLIALGVVLVLVVGGVAAAAAGGGHHTTAGGNGGTTASNGGTSWSPPSWATKANDIGPANPSTVVQGTVWIAKQHPQNLASYAAQVGMPGTPDYHKYLTPDQFNSTFVNVQDASSAVTQWLQQDGMTIVNSDPQSIIVKTTLDKVESTLKVQIDRFKHDGRVDIAPTSQPQYPSNVGDYVSSVTGLTTSSPVASFAAKAVVVSPKKKGKAVSAGAGKFAPGGATGIDTQWCSTYWGQKHYNDAPDAPWGAPLPMPECGYTANQMRHAYGV